MVMTEAQFFESDEMITPLVTRRKMIEQIMYRPKVKLTELEKVLRRDDAKILLPEIIDERIQTKVEEERIGRTLVDLIPIQSDSISWLEETGFNAEIVPEGAEVPIAHATWEKFFVSVLKIGVRPVLTKEMIEDAQWPVLRRNLDQAARAMAKKEDELIMDALNAGVPNGIAISDGVGGIGTVIHNHRISMGPNTANNPLTNRSIAKGRTVLREENYTPDVLLCNPTQMYELMLMEEFIGGNSPAYQVLPEWIKSSMVNGTIGTVFGMKVVVSSNQPAGQVLMFDTDVYAALFERRPVTTNEYTDVVRELQGIVLTQRMMPAVLRRDAAVMLNQGRTNLMSL